MLFAGYVRDHRVRAGRDKDGFGGNRGVARAEMYRAGIFERGVGHEAINAGLLEDAGIDAVQPIDLASDIANQRPPVELEIVATPAESLGLGKFRRIFAAVD